VILPQLQILEPQSDAFCWAQTAPKQKRDDGSIPSVAPTQILLAIAMNKSTRLIDGKPVPNPLADALRSFDSSNASGEFRTKETGVCRFVGESSDCS
jgi:hypothetical protein